MTGTHAHPLAAECVLTARRSEALKAGLPPGELAAAQAVAGGYNVTTAVCDERTQCYSSKYRFRQMRAPNAAAFYGVPHGTSPMHAQLPLELLNKIAAYNTSRTAATGRATGSLMSDSEAAGEGGEGGAEGGGEGGAKSGGGDGEGQVRGGEGGERVACCTEKCPPKHKRVAWVERQRARR
eukprot:1343310-Prymnesium_polylepis.2